MMTATTAIAAVPQSYAHRVVEVLVIVAVFFVLAGDPPPHVNESHYLCRLKHYWDPAWCAGDLFLESADTQLVLIWLFGWVTKLLSLPATAWAGRLVVWTMLAWAWQRLSWRVVPVRWASVLAAALFVSLNAWGHLAGEWIVGGVEAKCFAYAFVLLALRELIDNKWNWTCVLLGAATAFHPLVGGWSAILCGGVWLVQQGDRSMRARSRELRAKSPTLRSMLSAPRSNGPVPVLGMIFGALLGLIGLVPALSLSWNEPADQVAEASRIYVFERLPHHLAPLELPREELMRRLGGHAVLIVGLAALGFALRHHAVFRLLQFAWGAVTMAIIGLVIEISLAREPLLAARVLRYYWFRLTDFAVPMAVALAAITLITVIMPQRRSWATGALIATMAFSIWQLGSLARARLDKPVPPADRRMVDYSAWVDVCDWVAENSSAHTLFLTPRLNHSFKWRTGRPEVVNRKDIPQDTRGIIEWNRRIKDIYYYDDVGGLNGPIDSLSQLETARVRELAKKYGAEMVLADRSQVLALPRAYWNEEYAVYRVED